MAVIIADTAPAQTGLWTEPVLPGLRRVDEGVADTGPLSVSQRLVPLDLRVPTGFQGVYEFQRPTPFGRTETMYMRSSGGLSAVFPRSVYIPAPGGLVPEIPAGTVFVIGMPQVRAIPSGPSQSPMAVDMSVSGQAALAPPRPPIVRDIPAAEPVTIWNNERLRQQRVGRLLQSLVPPRRER